MGDQNMHSKKIIASAATSIALAGVGFVSTQAIEPMIATHEVQASNVWVNDYIKLNNIKPVQIEYQKGTFDRYFGYRNGVGRPEGIVIHETATPNVGAQQYVNSFNNNWPRLQTYVHAFTDADRIINIHSTDYGVWGAGPEANNRFIQIELCRVNNENQFDRSIANDAYYTASKLIQYNLPFIPGKTVLSHHDVSNNWGQTNHTDPDGYFAAWQYNMNQFYELVGQYYNNLKATGSVEGGNEPAPQPVNPDKGVVLANNPDSYAVPLIGFNADGTARRSNRGVMNNSPWATEKSKMYQGHKYYQVSTNEWIQDTYATFTPQGK